jgi:hypothetical protein
MLYGFDGDPALSDKAVRAEEALHCQKLILGVMPVTVERLKQTVAAFGVEVRHPFWDRRLIEFLLGQPPHFKTRHGCNRWLMHHPQWRRGKSNVGHSFKHCLIKHGMGNMNGTEAAPTKFCWSMSALSTWMMRTTVFTRILEIGRRHFFVRRPILRFGWSERI